MIGTLAFRHLLVKKARSLFLLLGFSIGVGVMITLLSVGEAMLDQSRDVSLVGGGELTVLPQGIDVEAMRTGGLGGMFFSIERAKFLTRQALGGARHRDLIRTVAPAIEGKLIYLCPASGECRPTAVRAGGEIPSRSAALGAGRTRPRIPPMSRPLRSSSTTTWTTFISRARAIRPGASGITSTWSPAPASGGISPFSSAAR